MDTYPNARWISTTRDMCMREGCSKFATVFWGTGLSGLELCTEHFYAEYDSHTPLKEKV